MKGFTLIELLIVIGILGVLIAVVVVALNPVQNLAKTRDAGRLSTISQLGHALESYSTGNGGSFVPEAGCGTSPNWINCLTASGDVNVSPALVANSITAPLGVTYAACGNIGGSVLVVNGWCYDAVNAAAPTGNAIVYSRLESSANHAKCPLATNAAWGVYSTADGKGGIVCTTAFDLEPVAGAAGSLVFR